MKMIDKIIVEAIIYVVLISIWMIWSYKSPAWRTYFYVTLYSIPVVFLLTVFPLTENSFQIVLILALILFWLFLIAFNVLLINKDSIEFSKYCTSKLYSYVFVGIAVVLLSLSLIFKCLVK
jgi:hypothetical protein